MNKKALRGYVFSLYNTGFIGIDPCRTTYVKEGTVIRVHTGAGWGASPMKPVLYSENT